MIIISLLLTVGFQLPRTQAQTPTQSSLQQLADDAVNNGIPAIVIHVSTPTHTLMITSGWQDKEKSQSVIGDEVFRIGSVTKLYTATLVLQLIEEDQLSLNDFIVDYLPQFSETFPFYQDITIRDVLNHRSGLPEFASHASLMQFSETDLGRYWTPVELIFLASQHTDENKPPQYDWRYTNTNYVLLGMLIESVTGQSLNQNYQQRILDPLALNNTSFAPLAEDNSLTLIDGHSAFLDAQHYNPSMIWSAGAMVANAEDVSLFLRSLFVGDLYIDDASIKNMLTATTDFWGNGYGLGVELVDTPLGISWGHDGAIAGYMSVARYFPDHDMTLVILINADGDWGFDIGDVYRALENTLISDMN